MPVIRRIYHARRDAMLSALEQHMPEGVSWTRPTGGMFIWLTLPPQINSTLLLRASLDQQVAFVPGASFHPSGGGENTLRLNFSHSSPERIAEGVARLGRAVAESISAS